MHLITKAEIWNVTENLVQEIKGGGHRHGKADWTENLKETKLLFRYASFSAHLKEKKQALHQDNIQPFC